MNAKETAIAAHHSFAKITNASMLARQVPAVAVLTVMWLITGQFVDVLR